MDKYSVDVSGPGDEQTKTAESGCGREDCPQTLDASVNPPKCSVCGYEYLGEKSAQG